MKNIIKIVTALATIAGFVYIIATYGEQIVAWAKKMLNCLPKCPACEEAETVVDVTEEASEAPVTEESPAEEAAVEVEEPAVEEPAPEIVVAENEPVAEEADFAE